MSFKDRLVYYWRRHPVLNNFLLIVITGIVLIWLVGVVFLNMWTRHGEDVKMPQVTNLPVRTAQGILKDLGFEVVLDSVYSEAVAPGTVLKQIPSENSNVKKEGIAYLQYACYSVKKVKVPAFVDMSRRQAEEKFTEIGIKNIQIKEVESEHSDLVLGALYNGVQLHAGMEIPVNAHIVLQVGKYVAPEYDYYDGYEYQEDADAEFIETLDDDFFE